MTTDAGAPDAAAAAAAAATKGADTPWHGLTDPAEIQYVENKGWKAPADIIKGYRGVETFVGRDPSTLIVAPRADDPAGLRAVLGKLGLPESAEKYEFAKPPEGLKPDEGYQKFARDAFHKVGLLGPQVKELTALHNEYVKGVLDQQEKDYNLAVETDKKALLAEWKNGSERMMQAAQSAATALGFTPEMIDAMERAVGYAGTWKHFAALGQKLGEPGFKGGDSKPAFTGTLTPAEAKAEWNKMTLDTATMAALRDKSHPGHKAAQEKQNALFAVMYPPNG